MVMHPFAYVSFVAVLLLVASGILAAAGPAAARKPAQKAIPLPGRALLEAQPPPQCRLSKAPEGINPNEALMATLDYERQCYRQAEEIVRARLDTLQAAVRNTVRADNNGAIHKRVARHEPRPVHRRPAVRLAAPRSPALAGKVIIHRTD